MTTLLLAAATAAYLLIAILFFAARRPSYSHLRDTLSELGEVGAADGRLVSFGIFLPVGLGLLAAAALIRDSSLAARDPLALLAFCVAAGYLVAAFFPCDPGSPLSGSARQGVHNLGGAAEYVGGALALFRLAESQGALFQAFGGVVAAAVVLLSLPQVVAVRGLVQRLAETSLFLGLLLPLWQG